jgi:exopolysaccharide biosynthesis polyprenyl glycosylphosphotransferase
MGSLGIQTSFAPLSLPLTDLALARPAAASSTPRRFIWAYRWLEPVCDSLAAAAAVQGTTLVLASWHQFHSTTQSRPGVALTLVTMLLVVGVLQYMGAYRSARSLLSIRETADALAASAVTALFLYVLCLAGMVHLLPGQAFAIAPALFLLLLVEKNWLGVRMMHWHERGYGVTKVAICGSGIACKRLYTTLVNSPKLGLWPTAVIDPSATGSNQNIRESGYRIRRSTPVLAQSVCCATLRRAGIERVLLIASSFNNSEIQDVFSEASRCGLQVQICGNDLATSSTSLECADIDGVMLWNTTSRPLTRTYELAKRGFDALAALSLIIAFSPVLAAIAVAIKLTSPGDVIFRQVRVGRRNRRFTIYKFRSMHVAACGDGFSPTSGTDNRISAIGRILRKTSLDELPQLFNVLKGEMSLVGPRPEMRFIVDGYTPLQARRLEVAPGITGLWQLSADRKDLIHNNVEYDLYYLRNRSFCVDIAILLHTVIFATKGI